LWVCIDLTHSRNSGQLSMLGGVEVKRHVTPRLDEIRLDLVYFLSRHSRSKLNFLPAASYGLHMQVNFPKFVLGDTLIHIEPFPLYFATRSLFSTSLIGPDYCLHPHVETDTNELKATHLC